MARAFLHNINHRPSAGFMLQWFTPLSSTVFRFLLQIFLHNNMPSWGVLQKLEEQYDPKPFNEWIRENWILSLYASAAYLIVVFIGRRLMEKREPFSLRRAMLAWNVGLAAFSIMGASVIVPNLYKLVKNEGFVRSVCWADVFVVHHKALWSAFFTLSKIFELFDTLFIVLRKSPLPFLHYYHHVTVLIYTWYGHAQGGSLGQWFGGMNYTIHSLMYSYYALKACGVSIPGGVMQTVTLLQLSQMGMGLVCNYVATGLLLQGEECMVTWNTVYIGYVIYASYAVLFANFFYQRYVRRK